MKRKFEKDLDRTKDAVLAAQEHFNIWYIYKNQTDRPKYVDVMNNYCGFFSSSISAQFTAMLLCLSKVLDSNIKKQISMYSIVELAEKENFVSQHLLQKIKHKLDEHQDLFKRIQKLRNNQFVHLGKWDSDKAFKEAKVSLNDFKNLINSLLGILQDIYYDYKRERPPFKPFSKDDTYLLLNHLLERSGD